MSNHIRFFLHLCHHIIKSGQKLDDVHVVYAILLSLLCSNIWDIVKQNLLDKESELTLNTVTAELLSVHNCTGRE